MFGYMFDDYYKGGYYGLLFVDDIPLLLAVIFMPSSTDYIPF